MKKTLIIDGNAIGYAAQGTTKLHSGGLQTQAAFGAIRTLADLKHEYPDYTFRWLWDGRADWRFALHPDYKSNRDDDPVKVAERNAYVEMRPYIARALSALGVWQMTAYTHEADDIAGYFVQKMSVDPNHQLGLITGDRDWLQLVRRNVFWRDPRDDAKYIDHHNFYDRTGCKSPFAFLETKILQGDTSDCISGVGGIGKGTAPEFIAEFGSVRNFWQLCDSGAHVPKTKAQRSLWKGTSPFSKDQWAAQLDLSSVAADDKQKAKMLKAHKDAWPGQGRLLYRRNFRLMQLMRVEAPSTKDTLIDAGSFNKDAFAQVCEELSFTSILRTLDKFTNRFQPRS